jgi:hypothetical protein
MRKALLRDLILTALHYVVGGMCVLASSTVSLCVSISAWRKGCTATLTHSYKLSASSNRLQLICFKQDMQILIILHFQQADLKSV